MHRIIGRNGNMRALRIVLTMRTIIVSLTVILTSGCAPGSDLPRLENFDGSHYQLGIGDQIRVLTFGVEQLSGTFRVNDSGDVELPLIGSFHAAGDSTRELRTALASEFEARKLLRAPSVSIEVVEYRPIFVLGEVSRPGQYPYQPGMKMLTAVAVAGGFTYRAVDARVRVLRSAGPRPVTGRADLDNFVAPGDVITVLERYF
jgi:polysaccharide export outer membrane protein